MPPAQTLHFLHHTLPSALVLPSPFSITNQILHTPMLALLPSLSSSALSISSSVSNGSMPSPPKPSTPIVVGPMAMMPGSSIHQSPTIHTHLPIRPSRHPLGCSFAVNVVPDTSDCQTTSSFFYPFCEGNSRIAAFNEFDLVLCKRRWLCGR